jgi:hypothetical protein
LIFLDRIRDSEVLDGAFVAGLVIAFDAADVFVVEKSASVPCSTLAAL